MVTGQKPLSDTLQHVVGIRVTVHQTFRLSARRGLPQQ